MSLVNGKDVNFFVYDAGVWKLCACVRSISLNVASEVVETSVAGAGQFATFLPSKITITGTVDGVVALNETGMLGLPDLRQRQIAGTQILCRFNRVDMTGNIYTDEVYFYITNTSDVNSFDNVSTFNMALQGNGGLTQIFTPIVPVPPGGPLVHRYEWTASAGTGFTDSVLIGKTILEVNTDGRGDGRIILSGTPVGDEVKYIGTTGQFVWGIPFEDGEEVYILYQDI